MTHKTLFDHLKQLTTSNRKSQNPLINVSSTL